MVRIRGGGSGATAAGPAIAGGFAPIPVATLMAAWRACRARPLGIGDFRAWLACHELEARRCLLEDGRPPAYDFPELARLLGVSPRRAGASIGRLAAAGLVEWSGSAVGFPGPPAAGPGPDLSDTIGGGRGVVAVPRRLLRFLAGGARPALIATALAVLLRCLSRRRGGFDGRGRVKASWIARTFGVDLRRVKAARRELVELGWIAPEASDQRAENRWGRAYRVDLGWDRPGPDGRRLPPLPPPGPRAIATPSVDQEPLPERGENQEPARSGPAGVDLEGRGRGPIPGRPGPPAPGPTPAPTLADVRPEDLRETGRALELLEQAIARGLAGPSEADRLRFLALAEHARAVGRENPPGLFAHLLRGRCWRYITQDDEDAARRRLREHLHGPPPGPAARPGALVPDGPARGPSSLADVLAARYASRRG